MTFHDPVLQAYALSVATLIAILYFLAFDTARTRGARQVVVNHEDAGGGQRLADSEHPDVLRLQRAHLNSLENAVPFFAIGLLYTATAPGVTLTRVLFGVFVATRVLHAVFYVGARQPWRTLSFVTCSLVNLFMTEEVARAALSA